MNVVTTLIADGQPTIVVQPGEGALCYPPVAAQPLAALYSFACDAALDASLTKSRSASGYVIRLISVPLVRAKARASRLTKWTFDRLDSVHHLFKHHRVVSVGTRQPDRQRDTPSLDHNMALRARFALICGVRPNSRGLWVPLFTPLARMVSLSRLALDQSILSASPRRSSSARCSLRHTPHSSLLPVAQSAPAGDTTATAHLLRQHLPGQAATQHEDDASEGGSVRYARTTSFGLRWLRW